MEERKFNRRKFLTAGALVTSAIALGQPAEQVNK